MDKNTGKSVPKPVRLMDQAPEVLYSHHYACPADNSCLSQMQYIGYRIY